MRKSQSGGFGGLLFLMPLVVGGLFAFGSYEHPDPPSGNSCGLWNTWVFFVEASVEDVQTCLDAGADANVRSSGGNTPLHAVALLTSMDYGQNVDFNETTRLEIIMALVDAGARVKARNNEGRTAFDYIEYIEKLKGTDIYFWLHDGR